MCKGCLGNRCKPCRGTGQRCCAPTGLGFLFYFADAGFEGLQGEVSLFFVDYERRREADGVGAGTEDEQAFVEGEIDDGIAQVGGFFLGALVADDFDADHEAAAADIADDWCS